MKKPVCIFLDPGHGGLHPVTQEYTTAPDKQYAHDHGEFHCDGWFYEGVSNRVLCERIAAKLLRLGFPCYQVAHEWDDTPLPVRVDRANVTSAMYERSVYLSIHSNAFQGGRARGFEVFTSPGDTESDRLAEAIYARTVREMGKLITYRPDTSDGDNDREANFYVLRHTTMPAVLVEYLFFDNYEDAVLLTDPVIQDRLAEATVSGILRYLDTKKSQ